MNRRNALRLSAISALGLALSGGNAAAQSAKDLVGSWTPVSVDAYGPNPKGSLIFEANGRYSLQLIRPDLPKYQSNNRTQATPAEYRITVEGSLSHLGTYSVSGTDLIFHVEASTFPNWTGTDQKRINLSVTGDELKYTNLGPSGGYQRLVPADAPFVVWRRVK
jgi:Lipocalin-like domain